jgi:hypothetical protein
VEIIDSHTHCGSLATLGMNVMSEELLHQPKTAAEMKLSSSPFSGKHWTMSGLMVRS